MTKDNNIQRYTFWKFHPSEIKEKADGEWIKHKDHLKKMSELSYELNMSLSREQAQAKEIERLRSENQEMGLFMFMRTHS